MQQCVRNVCAKFRVDSLSILTGKAHPQIVSSTHKECEYEYFGNCYIKSTIYKRFLYSN